MSSVLENIDHMSAEISNLKMRCEQFRSLLDEGTYKMNAALNVVNGLKTREQNILVSGEDPATVQQINEEQIDSFLELLKSPAFQSIARQFLAKYMK